MARRNFKSGGRSKLFLNVPIEVLKSPACSTLPPSAFKLLMCLAAQYKGYCNGDLAIARPILEQFGLRSRRQIYAGLKLLEDRGLIVKSRQGGRNRCSLYAVTWFGIDCCKGKHDLPPNSVPSHEWKNWEPTE